MTKASRPASEFKYSPKFWPPDETSIASIAPLSAKKRLKREKELKDKEEKSLKEALREFYKASPEGWVRLQQREPREMDAQVKTTFPQSKFGSLKNFQICPDILHLIKNLGGNFFFALTESAKQIIDSNGPNAPKVAKSVTKFDGGCGFC